MLPPKNVTFCFSCQKRRQSGRHGNYLNFGKRVSLFFSRTMEREMETWFEVTSRCTDSHPTSSFYTAARSFVSRWTQLPRKVRWCDTRRWYHPPHPHPPVRTSGRTIDQTGEVILPSSPASSEQKITDGVCEETRSEVSKVSDIDVGTCFRDEVMSLLSALYAFGSLIFFVKM